ncbi:MAG TPA: GatB/YqeY domain-containing protein, partial [Xanthobacteraceae bacterium]|nr:GatB/YqeY domain-containing protein [Xanthobacteraceae bacterium]
LPKQMSDDEVKSAIAAIVKETGAASMKDMGRVMAALRERYSGKMDFAKAGGLGKGQLAS